MKDKLYKVIIAVLGIALIIATIICVVEHNKRSNAENQSASSQKVVSQAATIINHYIDTSKRNHVVISSDSNKLSQDWYKNGTAISGGLVDTVTAALNIARKQLQEVTQIASETRAAKLKADKTIDSLKQVTYFYKDKYLELAYRPAKVGDTTSNGEFEFKYNDSLNVVQYWKRAWLLGAKKSYIDIYSNDPRTTINGVKRLKVEQKEPAFGLRIQAVSNYNFSRGLINAGPGVQFDYKRLSLVGSYYYDFDANLFRPALGARYDLIRF